MASRRTTIDGITARLSTNRITMDGRRQRPPAVTAAERVR